MTNFMTHFRELVSLYCALLLREFGCGVVATRAGREEEGGMGADELVDTITHISEILRKLLPEEL